MIPPPDRETLLRDLDEARARVALLEQTLHSLERPVPAFYDPGEPETITRRFESQLPPPPAVPKSDLPLLPGDATIAEAPQARRDSAGPPPHRSGYTGDGFEGRYIEGALIGEGGMGEVRLYTDKRIGRSVAMKVMRPSAAANPKLRNRFLFEARVQGQLEHPNIVPVHDIGVRPDGLVYFTMKRLVGSTLYHVLRDLRGGDRAALEEYSQHRLLTVFDSICLAVAFAHQHGVVHRDLKPSNIMLGRFGEVSLLDWGIAKRMSPEESTTPVQESLTIDDPYTATAVGEVLGTPGYMSPEQALGEGAVTPQSDVFALGAILFEILTLERFIPGDSDTEVRLATLAGGYESRISLRCPGIQIAPELEAICLRATARMPDDRMRSAEELHVEIQRYLESSGDRVKRIALSKRHTYAAIQALAELRETSDVTASKAARERAAREVMQALALHGDNPTALRAMAELLTYVPTVRTPETEAAVRRIESESVRKTARRAAQTYVMVTLNLGVAALLGVRMPWLLALAMACLLGSAGIAYFASYRREADERWGVPILLLSSVGFAMVSALFGPFVFAPALVAANVIASAIGLGPRMRMFATSFGVLAVLAPIAAPYLGLVPASWVFSNGTITILPQAVNFEETWSVLFLAVVSAGLVILPTRVVGKERDARAAVERRLALQAQQLAELLPAPAKDKLTESLRERRGSTTRA